MTGAVSFDGNSLQTFDRAALTGIITDTIDHASIPDKIVNMFNLAHASAQVQTYSGYSSKMITIKGTVAGSSESDLDSRLDTFRGYFLGSAKNLDIQQAGGTRRWITTLNSASITISENKRYATFTLQFMCLIPFGSDTATTTALNQTGRTSNSYSDNYTFLGNAPSLLPKITITLTAVSATGSQQLSWGNSDTGQTIVITRNNWTAGDVVVIDCDARTVTVNGVAVDFSGAFPEFTPGAHGMVYADTFNSRTMTENVVYYKRYL